MKQRSQIAKLCNPALLVTSLVLLTAVMRLAAQFVYTANPEKQFGLEDVDQYGRLSLWTQNWYVSQLQQQTDPVEREKICIADASIARKIDRVAAPNARIFVSGVLGRDGAGKSSFYVFLQNYLFPRDVEISLDGRAAFTDGTFEGVPCDSPEILQAKGFDILIQVNSPISATMIPLNERATRK